MLFQDLKVLTVTYTQPRGSAATCMQPVFKRLCSPNLELILPSKPIET